MNRRDFLAVGALPLVTGIAPGFLSTALAQPGPFDRSIVRKRRATSEQAVQGAEREAARQSRQYRLRSLRAIRFLPERALWHGEKLAFEAQFFHRGFFYKNRVDIFEVKNGQASIIPYQPRAVFVRRSRAARPGRGSRFCRLPAPYADQQAGLL